MQTAASSIEFSFNNIVYRQIDGVTLDSPLGSFLANIFAGYCEALLFKKANKPLMCYRYLMIPLQLSTMKTNAVSFSAIQILSIHRFTFEKECNRTLPFLDVLLEKKDRQFVISVYRKPTFTDKCIR